MAEYHWRDFTLITHYLSSLLNTFLAKDVKIKHIEKGKHNGYFICGFYLVSKDKFDNLAALLKIKDFCCEDDDYVILVAESGIRDFLMEHFQRAMGQAIFELNKHDYRLNGKYEDFNYVIDETTYKSLQAHCSRFFYNRGFGFGTKSEPIYTMSYRHFDYGSEYEREYAFHSHDFHTGFATIYYICPEMDRFLRIIHPQLQEQMRRTAFLLGTSAHAGKDSMVYTALARNSLFSANCVKLIFEFSEEKPLSLWGDRRRDNPPIKAESLLQQEISQLIHELDTEIKNDGIFSNTSLKKLKHEFLSLINHCKDVNACVSFYSCARLAVAFDRELYIKSAKGDISQRTSKLVTKLLNSPEDKQEHKVECKL